MEKEFEEIKNNLKNKGVSDLSEKHFSRYGEFLVSFELSKHGWNVYNPVYDEYIDFLIHKHVCTKCGEKWNLTPVLVCKQCGKDFSKSLKKDIIATKICMNCNSEMIGNKMKCDKCESVNLLNKPSCDKCSGEVEMIEHKCQCGAETYKTKFRSIQVKSSRIEYDAKTGKCKNTYAVDMKPRDLVKDKYHFFIWCLIDEYDRPSFIVMSVSDFIETMGDSIKGISFFKDQDRQHFSAKNFGKWHKFKNCFHKLE